MSLLIKNGTLICMDEARSVKKGDLFIKGDSIQQIGPGIKAEGANVIDASDCWVLPGLIQTHIHLCQTIFRNQAENLELLDWLEKKIWPLEASHTKESLTLSAQLGVAELLKGGTTTILDMGTVHHTEAIFEVCKTMGIRAFCGKAMMDIGRGVPKGLLETKEASIHSALTLINDWHGKENGRLSYALAPRFALSCTEELLKEIVAISKQKGILIHTHAAENKQESAEVKKERGASNLRYLASIGMLGPRSCVAHCVWVDDEEMELLYKTGTHVLHCPSSNLKLGSGIAPVPEMIKKGVNVSLGADGAPCNNTLDVWSEMRLAGLIQKPRAGVKSLLSEQIMTMATVQGAKALGIDNKVGSLEVGKKGDVIVVSKKGLHSLPHHNPYDSLVYATRASDVKTVIVDGKMLVENQKLLTCDEFSLVQNVDSASLLN